MSEVVRFVGDIHGYTKDLRKKTEGQLGKFIALGDIGFGFGDDIPVLDNVYYIRGNHDDPAAARSHPRYLGDYGEWNGIFFVSGAFSIDHRWRKAWMEQNRPRKIWWPDEELSQDELDKAFEMYADLKPRSVASHEAPSNVVSTLLNELLFRPEKVECIATRTSQALQRMLNYHQPEHWHFGHYHLDWQKDLGGTRFHCLNELSVSD
jgi:hypothetical protein